MKIKKSLKKLACTLLIVGTLMTTTAVVASAKETDTAADSTQASVTEIQSNYGDKDENIEEPLFKCGDIVEVYNSPLHIATRTRKIVAMRYQDTGIFFKDYHWEYKLEVNNWKDERKIWVTASDIQH